MRILYIDIDTLRPDHLGCYGYHRNTSPNIDTIAKEGIIYENFYCSDAPCLPSRTALTTGKFGIHTGVVGHGGTAADIRIEGESRVFKSRLEFNSLPGTLSFLGFKTVSISPFAERHGAWSFYAGWDEMHNTGFSGMEEADDITPTALSWIKQHAVEDNWFLHINYWDPHTPYRAPVNMGNPFAEDPLPEWLSEEVLEGHKMLVGPHKPGNINMFNTEIDPYSKNLPDGTIITPPKLENMSDLHQIIDGYDLGIRRADDHVGKIISSLKKLGVYEDLVIIISADHGENFGELGIYAEHGTADQATTRIPLIVRWPGLTKGKIIHSLFYNIDLLPTLAEILTKSSPNDNPISAYLTKLDPNWDGESFARTITEGEDSGRDYLIVSQCAHVCQRSVRFDHWMYIRTYHDGYHLFPQEMLFDLHQDPHEQFNLASKYPEICRQAVYFLNEWHDQLMKTSESAIDPLWTVIREGGPFHAKGHLMRYAESLEGSNRAWAVEELKNRHPGEFNENEQSKKS